MKKLKIFISAISLIASLDCVASSLAKEFIRSGGDVTITNSCISVTKDDFIIVGNGKMVFDNVELNSYRSNFVFEGFNEILIKNNSSIGIDEELIVDQGVQIIVDSSSYLIRHKF